MCPQVLGTRVSAKARAARSGPRFMAGTAADERELMCADLDKVRCACAFHAVRSCVQTWTRCGAQVAGVCCERGVGAWAGCMVGMLCASEWDFAHMVSRLLGTTLR